MIKTIKNYLERINQGSYTHTEVIIIATAIELSTTDDNLLFLVKTLKQEGINHNMRKSIARLMIQEIEEQEKSEENLNQWF